MRNPFSIVFLLSFCIFAFQTSQGQSNRLAGGVELDALPYITGGYYGGVWIGKSHLRGRALVARVYKPSFIIPDGFTNNTVTAYALVGDYFLKEDWKGWWISGGMVLWQSSIQSDLQLSTVSYDNVLLHGSIGFNWKFGRQFYISPWAGMNIRVGGAQTVTVDGKSFYTLIVNPEASLKIGWYFMRNK